VSQGQTKQEALENIKDAIAACLQVRAERRMPLIKFAEDWDSPEMSIYNNYDAAKANH